MSESNSSRLGIAELGSAEAGAAERKRILLVEGDGFTRLVLLLRLRLAGFGVDFTSNGILGIGKLRSRHPDVLLVELKLCGLSGLELIKAARTEPTFGNRPIYVYTQASRMNRATRKELETLDIKLFDKSSITREDLVQIFATTFCNTEPAGEQPPANAGATPAVAPLSEVILSGAIEELIAGVREQSELLIQDTGTRMTSGAELLSRVSSLGSCAKAAALPNLARHAKALENFQNELCRSAQEYSESALNTITRAVEAMSRMAHEKSGTGQSPARFRIVFVDEAPYSNRAMEEALLNACFEPACFEDPARAREYLGSHRTELIVANLVLPEAHGLAMADIRQLPLHSKTPILFGPELTFDGHEREGLPTSAPRLDKAPVLLAELVVRALNEAQTTNASASPPTRPAAPLPELPGPLPFSRPGAVASLPREDGYELFAKPPRQAAVTAFLSSEQTDPAPAVANQQAQAFGRLFTAAGIPSEPIMRAEPATSGADHEAELLTRLPVNPVDGSQPDESPLETLPPSALHAETPLAPQPEVTSEDQTVAAAWVAPAGNDTDRPVPEITSAPDFEPSEAATEQESTASTPNYGEVMNNHLQPVPTDWAGLGERSHQGEAPTDQKNPREDLTARVCAAEMALYHSQAQVEQRDKMIEALQRQLAETTSDGVQGDRASAEEGPAADQKAQARCAELEQEVAALRQALEDFNGSFGEQHQAAADAGKQVQELEQRLSQNAAELDKQKVEQARAEAELRRQLEAADTAGKDSEAARQQAEARNSQLEQELSGVRQAKEELASKLAQEQKASTESGSRHKPTEAQSQADEVWTGSPPSELEQQIRQGVADLARTTAELAKERGERQRSQQRAAELNARLQVLHEDFNRTLQAQREDLARISALEEQQSQTGQALDRRNADLEQHQAESRLTEEQLQKAKEVNAQLRKDLAFFEEANKRFESARQELQSRLEASLNAARENEARLQKESAERQRMADSLEGVQRELQNQLRRRETLEQDLQTANAALQEREAKLQKEIAERQRLSEVMDSGERKIRDGSERDLEFSKVQSALQLEQVERKRQETQLARMRQSALDAAHSVRALRTGLRRQIREPVDNLVHSAQSLLESEMSEAQKKLAEAVLQDVLMVQARLREPDLAHGEAETGASPSASTP
jgi:colicin import membrane protein